jgi:N-acetyl sugar amidotransferase
MRFQELKDLCDRYRRMDGKYDCIIPASGGNDSHFQTYVMKVLLGMNLLLVSAQDPFGKTEAGAQNFANISKAFGCDMLAFQLSTETTRKMVRAVFEVYGSPTWPIDRAIYTYPLQVARAFNVPLVVYGEDVSYQYGGPLAEESYSARNQIKNDVVKPIAWDFFYSGGVSAQEVSMLRYPDEAEMTDLEPIYLSYFVPWDGYRNYLMAKRFRFRDLSHEWKREGYLEEYDQIDSLGYLVHAWLKYPKFGSARATDVSGYRIRSRRITRERALELVRENDHKLDQRALDDFLRFTGYSDEEFWGIVERFWNREIFEKVDGEWRLKHPVWEEFRD